MSSILFYKPLEESPFLSELQKECRLVNIQQEKIHMMILSHVRNLRQKYQQELKITKAHSKKSRNARARLKLNESEVEEMIDVSHAIHSLKEEVRIFLNALPDEDLLEIIYPSASSTPISSDFRSKENNNAASTILTNEAALEPIRSEVIIPDPTTGATEESMNMLSSDNDIPRTSSSNTTTKPSENTGRWTASEHRLFLKGMELYGRKWKKVSTIVRTRTDVQTRTHAQKHFQKISKKCGVGNLRKESSAIIEENASSENKEFNSTEGVITYNPDAKRKHGNLNGDKKLPKAKKVASRGEHLKMKQRSCMMVDTTGDSKLLSSVIVKTPTICNSPSTSELNGHQTFSSQSAAVTNLVIPDIINTNPTSSTTSASSMDMTVSEIETLTSPNQQDTWIIDNMNQSRNIEDQAKENTSFLRESSNWDATQLKLGDLGNLSIEEFFSQEAETLEQWLTDGENP